MLTTRVVSFYQMYTYEMRICLSKNTLNSEEWWKVLYSKYAPSLVVHFFHLSGNLWIPQIFSFCCKPFFHIFVRTNVLLNKCVKSSMQTRNIVGSLALPRLYKQHHLLVWKWWIHQLGQDVQIKTESDLNKFWLDMNLSPLSVTQSKFLRFSPFDNIDIW